MEKSFLVAKESKYYKALERYRGIAKQQRNFVKDFLNEKGIETNKFYVGGDGLVNQAFREWEKENIKLYIIPTEKDLNSFGKMLTKADQYGLQSFKKKSDIAKEFAQRCIDEKVVINLSQPEPREYLTSLGWKGYSYQRFEFNGKVYLKVSSDYLKEDDKPDGFKEIKLSEYYEALEEFEQEKEHEET